MFGKRNAPPSIKPKSAPEPAAAPDDAGGAPTAPVPVASPSTAPAETPGDRGYQPFSTGF